MSIEDFDQRVDGVRKPDPTLGQNLNRKAKIAAAMPDSLPETVPAAPPPRPTKVRRQRVVLADPRVAASMLRARVELEEQTSWGEFLIKGLITGQLRTGLALASVVLAVLGSLPAIFYFIPSFARLSVIGLPLPWLILGVLPFPLLFGIGLWYNRLVERQEHTFVVMIGK